MTKSRCWNPRSHDMKKNPRAKPHDHVAVLVEPDREFPDDYIVLLLEYEEDDEEWSVLAYLSVIAPSGQGRALVVNEAAAVDGYGPLAYDIAAMIAASKNEALGPSDVHSREAEALWRRNSKVVGWERHWKTLSWPQFEKRYGVGLDVLVARGAKIPQRDINKLLAQGNHFATHRILSAGGLF